MTAGQLLRQEQKNFQLKATGECSNSSESSEDGIVTTTNDNSESGFR